MRDIKARTNGVINITTDGAPTMSVQERMQPALQLKPESACGEYWKRSAWISPRRMTRVIC